MEEARKAMPVWTPTPERAAQTDMARFMALAGKKSYDELHAWSIAERGAFWNLLWEFCEVKGEKGARTLVDGDRMPGALWFPDARLNFAENLLRSRGDGDAIVFWGEDRVKRRLSHRNLYDLVSRLSQALADAGVKKGDRVAGYLPNLPEATAAMLATASLGAVWSSCSPDFGVQSVLDRFGQIEPKVLFCADGYFYGGKEFDSQEKAVRALEKLPSVEECVVVDYVGAPATAGTSLYDFVDPFDAGEIRFEPVEFNHPLCILYSSGTTGVPKCIVHGTGGTLLQHLKEHRLHSDVKPGDRVFYFTTLGWMMWNWLVSGLASEATLLLYDGSPFVERGRLLFDLADAEGMTHFGTSAKFIDSLAKVGLKPKETHRLEKLRAVLSTGSPLLPEGFDYVYANLKDDLCLSSISG
ncbi:MAG TPA: acetoacetate--CoA ligase, partial [Burkholderiales bacterium]|nr:acetoacetate--CoA ligase [Burkholderiales bacterium]